MPTGKQNKIRYSKNHKRIVEQMFSAEYSRYKYVNAHEIVFPLVC